MNIKEALKGNTSCKHVVCGLRAGWGKGEGTSHLVPWDWADKGVSRRLIFVAARLFLCYASATWFALFFCSLGITFWKVRMGLDYEGLWIQDVNVWVLQTGLICNLQRRERESGNSIVWSLGTSSLTRGAPVLSVLHVNLLWIPWTKDSITKKFWKKHSLTQTLQRLLISE